MTNTNVNSSGDNGVVSATKGAVSERKRRCARVLITGAMGFFGWNAVQRLRQQGVEVILTSSFPGRYAPEYAPKSLDVLRLDSARHCIESCLAECEERSPIDAIIHAAAFSAPLACEKDPITAYNVNVIGTQNVAAAAATFDIPMIFLSTDLVFSGDKDTQTNGEYYAESEAPDARIVYGKSKIAAERMICEQSFGKWTILRSALMFDRKAPFAQGFPHFAVEALKAGAPATLFTDQFRTPAYIADIADAIVMIVERALFGEIFHCGGAERLNRVDFVRRYCALAGINDDGIIACQMSDVPDYTTRARDVSLTSRKLWNALGAEYRPTPLEEAFSQMLCLDSVLRAHPNAHMR
jgi:dTDP-4-dehydrorhamnose reductase